MGKLDEIYARSMDDPDGFWAEAAEAIDWDKKWDQVRDDSGAPHFYRWFTGGKLNTCYNCLDRHVENGRADQTAIIHDSPITGTQRTLTYGELLDQVSHCAGMLRDMGVGYGDRVIVYMPMIPEAAIAMLACARIGAVHSVVFGGFAASELAKRIKDCGAVAILTASCGLEPGRTIAYQPNVDKALAIEGDTVKAVAVFARPEADWSLREGRDIDWVEGLKAATPADCVPVEATDPLYILYTSGTTGKPKGVVRDNGGHAVALKWSMKAIYNIEPGEVFWTASDVGWVVGHSYIVYAPLLHGATTVMFEGKPVGTPDAGVFWRVIAEHGVVTLFTAPTAFRAIKKEDPKAELLVDYDLSTFRALYLAGERCDPDTLHWAEDILKVPVIDHWWQTETGFPMAANPLGIEQLPVKPGSPTRAVPGYDIQVLDDQMNNLPPGEMGAICVKLPLPPCCLPTLWNADDRYVEAYLADYPGYYMTGDAGYIDADGYVFVMGRTDDVINVAGHRLSTGAMEEILAAHPDVAECAVVGIADQMKGQLPLGLMVLKSGVTGADADIAKAVVQSVRDEIGAVAAFKTAVVVKRLPKTRSGKILRRSIAGLAEGSNEEAPATIDDPAILDEIRDVLTAAGIRK